MNVRPQPVVVASGNKGKLAEIRQILPAAQFTIRPQSEFGIEAVEETGETFLANALLKARHAASETGMIAIGDDSGLMVDALGGEPGIRSARYAGLDASDDDNITKLLGALLEVDSSDRSARFHCVVVLVFPDLAKEPLVASGEWQGEIATSRSGKGGFGYDPVFFEPELGKCAAEMTSDEKNARSYRGEAFRRLAALLTGEEFLQ